MAMDAACVTLAVSPPTLHLSRTWQVVFDKSSMVAPVCVEQHPDCNGLRMLGWVLPLHCCTTGWQPVPIANPTPLQNCCWVVCITPCCTPH